MSRLAYQSNLLVLRETKGLAYMGIGVSLVLHVLVFGLAYIIAGSTSAAEVNLLEATQVTLVRKGIERPKNWLPERETAPPPVKPDTQKINVNDTTPKQPKAEAQPPRDEPSAQEREAQRKRRMADVLSRIRREAGRQSEYGDPDGIEGGLSSQAIAILGNRWAGQLSALVRSKWSVPSVIPEAELARLQVKVFIRIDRNGKVLSHSLQQSSGNQLFDSSVVRAIRSVSSVPQPPDELMGMVLRDGFVFVFKRD